MGLSHAKLSLHWSVMHSGDVFSDILGVAATVYSPRLCGLRLYLIGQTTLV